MQRVFLFFMCLNTIQIKGKIQFSSFLRWSIRCADICLNGFSGASLTLSNDLEPQLSEFINVEIFSDFRNLKKVNY